MSAEIETNHYKLMMNYNHCQIPHRKSDLVVSCFLRDGCINEGIFFLIAIRAVQCIKRKADIELAKL
jgi:hypothetical protein